MQSIFAIQDERGRSEWRAFEIVRGDRVDGYPVADIRIRKEAKRKPFVVAPIQFVLKPR